MIAIGHSLGGWTVAALAGARFQVNAFLEDCQLHPLPACNLADVLRIREDAAHRARLEASFKDPRVRTTITLDLGLGRGLTKDSLRAIADPFLVVAADVTRDEAAFLENGYVSQWLPAGSSDLLAVEGATHFSFMQACTPRGEELLKRQDPKIAAACQDPLRDRMEVQRETAAAIIAFLEKAGEGQR